MATDDDGAVCVTDLKTALLAAETAWRMGYPLLLISETDAGIHTGGGWWRALTGQVQEAFPDLKLTALLDCGDLPGAALGAIRAGCEDLIVASASPALLAFAKARDVRLHDPPTRVLTLGRLNNRTGHVIERFLAGNF
ncbi:MAG: hypothetical protein AAF414_11155 [Pseudomonadota bacterium]